MKHWNLKNLRENLKGIVFEIIDAFLVAGIPIIAIVLFWREYDITGAIVFLGWIIFFLGIKPKNGPY